MNQPAVAPKAEQLAPSRIVRVEEDGQVIEVANLSADPSVFAAGARGGRWIEHVAPGWHGPPEAAAR